MSERDPLISVKVKIGGRVQGVGYRFWTQLTAKEKGLKGSVQNLSDGQVLAYFYGIQSCVDEMIALCHKGPAFARVDSVQVVSLEADALAKEQSFRVIY